MPVMWKHPALASRTFVAEDAGDAGWDAGDAECDAGDTTRPLINWAFGELAIAPEPTLTSPLVTYV